MGIHSVPEVGNPRQYAPRLFTRRSRIVLMPAAVEMSSHVSPDDISYDVPSQVGVGSGAFLVGLVHSEG